MARNMYTIHSVTKKKRRFYCLKILRFFGVTTSLLAIFYNALVCTALTFGMVYWGGNICKHKRGR